MKMVFIAYLRGFGGAQRQIINVANAMSKMGHDVTLISLSDNKKCYEIDRTIHFKYIKDYGTGLIKLLNRYKELKKVLLDIKPNVIVNFWLQSAYFTTMMKNKLNCKIIYSERGDPSDKQYNGLLGIIRKISFKKIDGFVFQTNAAKKYFSKDVQDRGIVIPNAVSVKKTKSNNQDESRTIVTVGRLHEQKNIPLVIEAFDILSNQYLDYQLLVYGDGELKGQLQNLIKGKKLNDRVRLCGATKNIHREIVGAKMFVLSSNYEGMPNALLEAMALGLPCISTDWKPGGVVDIIEDGKNGLIVPRNDAQVLSEAMKRLIDDGQLSKKISKNALISMRQYSPRVIYGRWEQFLANVVGCKGELLAGKEGDE